MSVANDPSTAKGLTKSGVPTVFRQVVEVDIPHITLIEWLYTGVLNLDPPVSVVLWAGRDARMSF